MKKMLKSLVAVLTCLAMVCEGQIVSVLAEEIQSVSFEETIDHELSEQINGENVNESFNLEEDDLESLTEEVLNPLDNLQTHYEENNNEIIDDEETFDYSEIPEETDEYDDILLNASCDDLSEESINALFYSYPEYLNNAEYFDAMSDAIAMCTDVHNNVDTFWPAVMELFSNGGTIALHRIWSMAGLNDDALEEYKKELAQEILYEYSQKGPVLASTAKNVEKKLSTINTVYDITSSVGKKQFKEDLKNADLKMSDTEVDQMVNAVFDRFSESFAIADQAVALYVLSMEYIELYEIDTCYLDDLIEIMEESGDEDAISGLRLLKENRKKNFTQYFIKYYAVDETFALLKAGALKGLTELTSGLSFRVGNVLSAYGATKIILKIISKSYTDSNPSLDEIAFSGLAFAYNNAARIMSKNVRNKFLDAKNGEGTVSQVDIENYEKAFTLQMVSLEIAMKYCKTMAWKQNGQGSEKYLQFFSDDVRVINSPRFTYSHYLKSCIKNINSNGGNVNIDDPEPDEEKKPSISARFLAIQNQFRPNVGRTWQGSWGGCTQCFGFARMIFSMLFGCEMPSAYSGSKPYLYPNEDNVVKIGQLEGSNVTADSVKQLFSLGKLGDVIQASGSVYGQHTMIFVGTGENYVRVYDCNAAINGGTAGSCNINEWNISFTNFAYWYGTGSSCGVTLYRASNYGEYYGDSDFYFYDDSVNFVIEDGVLIKYNGWQRNVVIPDEVTIIGKNAFKNCTTMQTVYIPNTVLVIQVNAFYGCSNLKAVEVPDSVERIDGSAFAECSSLSHARLSENQEFTIISNGLFRNSGLEQISFPQNITKIGGYAFEGCKKLIQIKWPEGEFTLCGHSFQDCTALKQVDIVSRMRFDNEYAPNYIFDNCTSLEKVNIEEGVEELPYFTFYGCSSLKNIDFPNSLKHIGYAAFSNTGLTRVVLPPNLQEIGEYAFSCQNLEYVYIPKSLGEYRDYDSGGPFTGTNAFLDLEEGIQCIPEYIYGGMTIQNVQIPETVTRIKDFAYSGCKNLKEIYIPDSVVDIDTNAFAGCTSLAKVRLPKDLKCIPHNCFGSCTSLKTVDIPDSCYCVSGFGGSGIEEIVLPSCVRRIDGFADCKQLKSITIPDGVDVIPTGCFQGCTSLEKIITPESVRIISVNAFNGCSSLTNYAIPNRVVSIGHTAFFGCNNLKSICIPDSVQSIGVQAFGDCSSLESVELGSGIKEIPLSLFSGCSQIENIVIPYGVTRIAMNSFSSNTKLQSIYIPQTVLEISDIAFSAPVLIRGNKDSYAEEFALSHGFSFEANASAPEAVDTPEFVCVGLGKSIKIPLKVKPTESMGNISWKSSNQSVATVSPNGEVSGVRVGKTIITAKIGNKVAETEVEVFNQIGSISIPKYVEIDINESKKLEARIMPSTASNEKLEWWSSNDRVVSVTQDGVIKGLSSGHAYIYVKETKGIVEEHCEVEVSTKQKEVPIQSLSFTQMVTEIEMGDRYPLEIVFYPNNANVDKTVIWKSSEPMVATIDDGEICALAEGKTTITATAGGKSATCTVVVKKPVASVQLVAEPGALYKGQVGTVQIVTDTGEIPRYKTVTASSREEVAKVENDLSRKLIHVHALAEGTSVITVSIGEIEESVTITVATPMIMFKDQDGSDLDIDPLRTVYGQRFPELPKPERNGKLFAGWFTGKNKTGDAIFESTIFSGQIVLYAGWIEDDEKITVLPVESVVYTGSAIIVDPAVYDGAARLEKNKDYTLSYSNNKNAGKGLVTVNGKGNYSKKETIEFTILPKPIGDGTAFDEAFSVTIADKQYTGKTLTSKPTIKLGKTTLKENKDYTLQFDGDMVIPGSVTVTVTGKENSNFTGEAKISYQIYRKQQSLTNAVITLDKSIVSYSPVEEKRRAQVVSVKVNKDAEDELQEGADYTVSYKNTDKTGTATVTVTGINGYGGSKSATYKITSKQLDSTSATIAIAGEGNIAYTGSALNPAVTVSDGAYEIPASCYSVSYANTTNAAKSDAINSKTHKSIAPTVTVKFKGNYKGTASRTFEIKPKELSSGDLSISFPNVKDNGKDLDATMLKPTIKYGSKTLKKDVDYQVIYEEDDLEVKTVDIRPIGNYSCSQEGLFVTPFLKYRSVTDVSDVTVACGEGPFIYSGTKITPVITASATIDGIPYTLVPGKDYTVSYSNNTNAVASNENKAPTYTVTGKGAFKGKKSGTFTIEKQELTKDSFTVSVADMKYNKGNEVKPKVTVTDAAGKVLKANKDYTVVYSNNKLKAEKDDDAAPTVTIEGIGNYRTPDDPEKVLSAKFRIYDKEISSVTVDAIESRLYTGLQIRPEDITVYSDKKKDPATKLTENVHYTVSYGENRTVGKGTVILTGKGEYGGTKTVTFVILPKWLQWLL